MGIENQNEPLNKSTKKLSKKFELHISKQLWSYWKEHILFENYDNL
jgi:hypothetical protein